jgi:hypothetical protein
LAVGLEDFRVPRLPIMLVALALSTACKAEVSPRAAATAAANATTAAGQGQARASAKAIAGRGGASQVAESTDLYEFDYSYPAEAGRIPALKAWLDRERDKARRQLIADATEGRASAKEGGFEYHAYAQGRAWEKVAETPRFLSLSAALYDYSGGAHPNHGYDSLLFDKQAGARLSPLDVFTSKPAFDAAIQPRFCTLLDQERSKRRGETVVSDGSMFNDCIKPSEQTVILGSSNGRTFDKVGILIGPYAAGSYAEGDYEFTLPVTAALLSAVKPGYRGTFSAR